MTPDRIAAERKVAQAMMAQGMDFSPVQSPWQGAARVAQAMMGGYDSYRADQAEKANLTANQEMITKLLNGGGDTPAQAATPAPAIAASPSTPPPVALSDSKIYGNDEPSPLDNPGGPGAMALASTKVGLGEKEAAVKDFISTGGQNLDPATRAWCADFVNASLQRSGMAGTGSGAARSFLSYGQPVAQPQKGDIAVFSRGNDPSQGHVGFYDGEDKNGIRVLGGNQNDAVGYGSYPKDRLLGYRRPGVGTDTANAPVRVASLGGATSPDSAPAPAQPAAAAPVQVAQAGGGGGGLSGVNPALIQAITSPYASEGTKKIATLLLQQKLQGDAVTTVDLGNAVGIMDKRGNIVRQVPKGEPNKGPTYGVVSKDEYGNEQYGWINPRDMTTRPNTTVAAAPSAAPVAGGTAPAIPPPPPGVNPKVWRDEQTRIAADAAGGKLTDAQVNATQFANRMEDAEANLATVEPEITAGGFGPFKDRVARGMTEGQYNPVPRGATNFAVSDSYQKFEQAKSQYITALLRKESGAAISQSEFDRYDKEFFPQMGDSKDVIKQKQQARKVAVDAMKKGAGPSYKSPTSVAATPTGVDPKVWAAMTPEEKSLWK